jgi:hypothetical protein
VLAWDFIELQARTGLRRMLRLLFRILIKIALLQAIIVLLGRFHLQTLPLFDGFVIINLLILWDFIPSPKPTGLDITAFVVPVLIIHQHQHLFHQIFLVKVIDSGVPLLIIINESILSLESV